MKIVLDFDGTCVTHAFPKIGKDIGAVPVLRKLINRGHQLILFTMRCNHLTPPTPSSPEIQSIQGMFLDEAIQWFADNDIPLYGIQTDPEQATWTTSPKAYGHLMIDDSALGCPLILDAEEGAYVDWKRVEKVLLLRGII